VSPRGLLPALALLAAGCATTPGGRSELTELQESVEAYNDAYRWKNYQRAALFLPPDTRAAFLATYEEDDKALHVEDYQILRADLVNEAAARVLVRVRFMQLPSVTLETRNLVQHWHQVSGRWLLETEENSIREVDPAKLGAADPDAFGGGPEPDPSMEIEVTDPDGRVLRKDGDPDSAAPAPEPEPAPAPQ